LTDDQIDRQIATNLTAFHPGRQHRRPDRRAARPRRAAARTASAARCARA
jgi:hypothetical protein